eukprot:gnl/MRDRNA2_/MRDRNA2_64566_c0_seq1.p1 gnl/MRDRNA2_/MRDRNA2_64566_c0~~gnl/MRDRNA2_/MRDRNA2_64566_c0_seq1.p1  ORF type:complete len:391 (-),score=80.25 gnl/MRDRNA2_/MRDRNA2_64566_c0_seq1:591-1763(-)
MEPLEIERSEGNLSELRELTVQNKRLRLIIILLSIALIAACALCMGLSSSTRSSSNHDGVSKVEKVEEEQGQASGNEKIILTSTGVFEGEEIMQVFKELLEISGSVSAKVMLITTGYVYKSDKTMDWALDEWAKMLGSGRILERRQKAWDRSMRLQKLLDLKEAVSVIDYSHPAFDKSQYKEQLKKVNVLLVDYGNTYALNYWMRRRGETEIIKQRVYNGELLYVGAGAGSILAGESIKTVLWKNDDAQLTWHSDGVMKSPASALKDEWASSPWDPEKDKIGLHLVPGLSVLPHYRPDWQHHIDWIGDANTITIADGEAVVYKPEKIGGKGAKGAPERIISKTGTKVGMVYIKVDAKDEEPGGANMVIKALKIEKLFRILLKIMHLAASC